MRITRRRFYKILDSTSGQTKRNYCTTFEQLPSHFITSKRYPVKSIYKTENQMENPNENQNKIKNKRNKSLKFI